MKKYTLLAATLLCAPILFAQQSHNHVHDAIEKLDPLHQGICGNNVEQEIAFAKNPELKAQHEQDMAQFELEYQQYLQSYDPYARAAYTIPVVVHIVHEYGSENISDEQVYDAIMRLNEDFQMTNDDLSNTIPEFAGITGNTDVEFKLATKDPSGQCHKGITRTYMPGGGAHDTGDNGDIRDAVDAAHGVWPQNKYMNIFVVKSIAGSAAYTNKPGNWYNASGNGGSIYMGHTVMGSMGTSNMSNRHILSHEVGHWLNLSHCWGNNNSAGDPGSCSTDDGVSDTPNTIGWLGNCNLSNESCGSLDNIQNIMDYAGSCRTMFTQGQSARMQAALNSSIAQRNNLWQTSNLLATGTLNPGAICEVDFESDLTTICAGQSVTFTDLSYHNVASRNWTFDGGSPATSTSDNPIVTYNTPGVYTVSLQASDGSNSITQTKNSYIVVLSDPGEAIPYHEGFEGITSIPDNDNWVILDENNDDAWELSTIAGSEGTSKSAVLGNYGNDDGSKDELISGTIDLSSVDPADPIVFTFDYAYRKKQAQDDEWLRFYISNDCGETWVLRKNIHGDDLSSVTANGSYVPSGPGDWYSNSVTNINSAYYVENFRFKFQFENDGGNNIYIDNINLYPASMTSLQEESVNHMISIYPNPTNGLTNIQLIGIAGQEYTITIHNSLGQQIDLVYQGELVDGVNNFEYDMSGLAKGVYLVRIESEGRLQTTKLIKE